MLGSENRKHLVNLAMEMKVSQCFSSLLLALPDDGMLWKTQRIFYIFYVYPHICSTMQNPLLTL